MKICGTIMSIQFAPARASGAAPGSVDARAIGAGSVDARAIGGTFGKKMKECREAKGLSQNGLATELGVHHSIIGKYERDEVKPSIDVVKKMAKILETTVGYLLGENSDNNVLKDPAMLKRLNEISNFTEKEREYILYTIDALITKAKLKSITQ